MKTDKEINDIIKKGLEEYAKAETKSENMDVKFSKQHEKKMKKMFDNMRKDANSRKTEDREIVIRIKFGLVTKVAVALIIFSVFISAVSTGLKAWKEHKLESYGGNEEYSWLLSNDTSEIYEPKTTEDEVEYVKSIFPGLSGEISDVEIKNTAKSQRLEFKYNGIDLIFKIRSNTNLGTNVETEILEEFVFGDVTVYCCQYAGVKAFKWNMGDVAFDLIGEVSKEDVQKIISSIKLEKKETNF